MSLGGVDTNVFHYVAAVMAKGGAMYRDTFDHKGPLLYFINYLGLKISYYSGAWLLEFVLLFVWVVFSLAVLVQAFLTDDIHAFWDFSCRDSVSSLRRFSCI